MTPIRWISIGGVLAIALAIVGWLGITSYGGKQYAAGRQALLDEQARAASQQQAERESSAAQGAQGAEKAKQGGAVAVSESHDGQVRDVQVITRYIHDSPSPDVCAMRDDDPVLRDLDAAAARANAAADDFVRRAGSSGEGAGDVP